MDKELHLIEIITSLLTLKVPLQQWYFGPIKQADAEKLLLQDGNSTGTFLIRESDSQPDNSSLSVQDGNCVHHYLIKKTDTGKECKLLGSLFPSTQFFPSTWEQGYMLLWLTHLFIYL